MEDIHNETVLAFLKLHREHPSVRRLLAEADREMAELNRELGTDYEGYLDYLKRNRGDDAACMINQLNALVATKRRGLAA